MYPLVSLAAADPDKLSYSKDEYLAAKMVRGCYFLDLCVRFVPVLTWLIEKVSPCRAVGTADRNTVRPSLATVATAAGAICGSGWQP